MIAPRPGLVLLLAALGAGPMLSDRRRRCAHCRAPSNRCPCRHCGSCSTSGGDPASSCACGKSDGTGEGERSPKVGGSPVPLIPEGER